MSSSVTSSKPALYFAAGIAAAGASYVGVQRSIWRSTAATADGMPGAPPPAKHLGPPAPLYSEAVRVWAVTRWNRAVDFVFEPVVDELTRRGW